MIRKIIRLIERFFHWDEFGTFDPPATQKEDREGHKP